MVESSHDFSGGLASASHGLEAWSGKNLALLSVSDESSDHSGSRFPAHSSGVVANLPDGAVLSSLSESSGNLSLGPLSKPLARSPLSDASLPGGASLALSHPDSDDSTLGSLSDDASGELLISSLPGGAVLVSKSPSSDHTSSLEVELLSSDASSPSSVALLVLGAGGSVSLEGSQDSSCSVLSDTSGELAVALSVGSADSSGLVLVGPDQSTSERSADSSLGLW